VEVIPHEELKERSRGVKTSVRAGEFTAWDNLLRVSGTGNRRQIEKPAEE
jgi:D-ribose pyranose/furanose isomerase RbsD